jgi:hypothetical protein
MASRIVKRFGHVPSAENKIFYIYFLIILQKNTTVSKFYSFDNHSPWPTVAVVAHNSFRSNRRWPRRFGSRPWALTGVEVSRLGIGPAARLLGDCIAREVFFPGTSM